MQEEDNGQLGLVHALVLDGRGGARFVTREGLAGLELGEGESLWLHWDRSHPQTRQWLRQDSGLSAADRPQIMLTPLQVQTVRALLRETVSNALRHSQARNVQLRFVPLPGDRLRLVVEDAGTGAGGDWLRQGSGLANLRFRVEACGGTLEIEPAPGGTRVLATLPLAGVSEPGTVGLERAAG